MKRFECPGPRSKDCGCSLYIFSLENKVFSGCSWCISSLKIKVFSRCSLDIHRKY